VNTLSLIEFGLHTTNNDNLKSNKLPSFKLGPPLSFAAGDRKSIKNGNNIDAKSVFTINESLQFLVSLFGKCIQLQAFKLKQSSK
jgi:hypothetical protein